MKIPRILHRIWLGGRPMPQDYVAFGRGWERLHPGWEMRLWSEQNLPPLRNRWAFRHAATLSGRSNVLRYEILHRCGGVYVDTDFECRRSLEPLLRDAEAFVGLYQQQRTEQGIFPLANNAILGAAPGHPFIADLVAEVEAQMRVLGAETSVSALLSGPLFLSSVLQRHPEVRRFPPKYFFPYGPHERWRRQEPFPHAYGVHHWTLSGLSGLDVDARRISGSSQPCLTVAIPATPQTDWPRLEWVLEGLREQTVADFEVLLPQRFIRRARRFRRQLRLRGLPAAKAWHAQALARARAPRVLFLAADCLPDPDVVARHAVQADRPVLLYGHRRHYPAGKFFPFRETVHYAAVQAHARSPKRRGWLLPRRDGWRVADTACFSVPRDLTRALPSSASARQLTAALSRAGCPSSPSLFGGHVTQFLRG